MQQKAELTCYAALLEGLTGIWNAAVRAAVVARLRASGLPSDDLLLRLQALSPTLGFAAEKRRRGPGSGWPTRSPRTRCSCSSAWCGCCSRCGRWRRRAAPSCRPPSVDPELTREGDTIMATIPEAYRDLFDKKAFAHLATVGRRRRAAGDAGVGRLRRHPRPLQHRARPREGQEPPAQSPGGAVHPDPDNPYRYVQVKGRVTEMTETGRRRPHRRAGQEVPRAGHVPAPPARRGAGDREDRCPSASRAWGESPLRLR